MKNQSNHAKRKVAGLPPGSVVFTGNRKVEKVFLHYLKYDEKGLLQKTLDNHADITFHESPPDEVDWYDVRGLHDTSLIELIGETFKIHPLVLEDVADTQQRPKFDEYDRGDFVVVPALHFDKAAVKIHFEQVALYFRKGLLVSFQENETDLFGSVRERLHKGRGKIRQRGADYLCYALIDSLVDRYFLTLDSFGEVIEKLEDDIIANPQENSKARIHHLKKELLAVRKAMVPMREAISRFSKSESKFITETSGFFLRDLYDHIVQIMDMVETYRDMLNGLQDLYLSEISFKMNQVMQVLTIITTIFVPLSFLAGLYGMNFDHMPELQYHYGYFILLGIMVCIFIGSLVYFRQKKWF